MSDIDVFIPPVTIKIIQTIIAPGVEWNDDIYVPRARKWVAKRRQAERTQVEGAEALKLASLQKTEDGIIGDIKRITLLIDPPKETIKSYGFDLGEWIGIISGILFGGVFVILSAGVLLAAGLMCVALIASFFANGTMPERLAFGGNFAAITLAIVITITVLIFGVKLWVNWGKKDPVDNRKLNIIDWKKQIVSHETSRHALKAEILELEKLIKVAADAHLDAMNKINNEKDEEIMNLAHTMHRGEQDEVARLCEQVNNYAWDKSDALGEIRQTSAEIGSIDNAINDLEVIFQANKFRQFYERAEVISNKLSLCDKLPKLLASLDVEINSITTKCSGLAAYTLHCLVDENMVTDLRKRFADVMEKSESNHEFAIFEVNLTSVKELRKSIAAQSTANDLLRNELQKLEMANVYQSQSRHQDALQRLQMNRSNQHLLMMEMANLRHVARH